MVLNIRQITSPLTVSQSGRPCGTNDHILIGRWTITTVFVVTRGRGYQLQGEPVNTVHNN